MVTTVSLATHSGSAEIQRHALYCAKHTSYTLLPLVGLLGYQSCYPTAAKQDTGGPTSFPFASALS